MKKQVLSQIGIMAYVLMVGVFFGLIIALWACGPSHFMYISCLLTFDLGFLFSIFIFEAEAKQ